MKVLLFGASGYIAGYVGDQLMSEGKEVIRVLRRDGGYDPAKTRNDCEYFSSASDVRELVLQSRPDVVINMTNFFTRTSLYSDTDSLAQVNAVLTTEICKGVVETGGFLINVGSAFQANLDRRDSAQDFYSLYKGLSTSILRWFTATWGLKACNLLLYDTYGRNDPRGKIVQMLKDANKNSTSLDLSEGYQILELVYVTDVANAISLLVNSCNEIFDNHNDGFLKDFWCYPDEPATLRGLVDQFEAAANSKLDIKWGSREYRPGERFEIEKGMRVRVPGWTPKVKLDEGLGICLQEY